MKTIDKNFKLRVLTSSLQGVFVALMLLPLAANADDAAKDSTTGMAKDAAQDASGNEADDLKRPESFVKLGVIATPRTSAKFGEYNGLEDSGAYPDLNFDLRGGNAYDGGDGTMRWEAKGTDLGTTSRNLGATIGSQGHWNLGIGYDELRHAITDTYQTPYLGERNTFVLPNSFGDINTGGVGTRKLLPNQNSYFHTEEIGTDRKNKSFNAGYTFDSNWNVTFDFNQLDQTGAKLISVATEANFSGAPVASPGGGFYRGQNIVVLPNPTDYQTDSVNFAINWTGEQARLAASYFGSFFNDKNNGFTFSNPFTNVAASGALPPASGFPSDAVSTMPDNEFHQFSLTGGYNFDSPNKLAGGISYGRNTQNSTYLANSMQVGGLKFNSLNGLVETYNANLKLTNQSIQNLTLTGGFKYNERDNETASQNYSWWDIGSAAGAETAHNTPYSNKNTQIELVGDYRINSQNALRVAYNYDKIKRWCKDLQLACVSVTDNTENRLGFEYRFKPIDSVNLNAGYSYGDKNASTGGLYYNPMQANFEGFDVYGFIPYFDASRKEHLAKAGVTWQATDKLDIGLNGRFIADDYNAKLGVQSSNTWSMNLDATFAYSENGSVTAYASLLKRERDMLNAGTLTPYAGFFTSANGTWANTLSDDEDSIGFNAKQKGLFGGKLDLSADASYVLGTTGYSTSLYYAPAAACNLATQLTCGSTPDISNRMLQLKLNGDYKYDKHSTVSLSYLFQRLDSNDYFYNAYQYANTPATLLPTNQQSPSYSVNVLIATYTYNFK